MGLRPNTDLPAAAKELIASQGWSDEAVGDFIMGFVETRVDKAQDKIGEFFEAAAAKAVKKMADENPEARAQAMAEYDDKGFLTFEAAELLGVIMEMGQKAMNGLWVALARQELGDIDDELTDYLAANATAQQGL
jgi:hypothetical protein